MFLKTLTLKGFKSFAEPTLLEFEPGVTVVVGPNGSGKSNVVDAVAWVLGAQGPKTVRSSRMDDVIFAGTPRRPALGRAEVSLVIDNSAGRLPIGLAEVTITRTLFRSGESEYAINGAPCRLLDVQELLSDSGVGRQQHVIVGQGQLDNVLSSRPEDRRLMIEEAAGVLKYRRRRERAERRLEATEGNLLRLQDLLREVRRQLRPLERQADAARRYSGIESELRAVRLYLAGRNLESLGARRESSERTRASIAAEERQLRVDLAALDSAVAAAEAELSQLRQSDLSEPVRRLERLTERARGLRAVLSERARAVAGARQAAMDRGVVASLEAEEADLSEQIARVDAEATSLGPPREELAAAERELLVERDAVAAAWGAGGDEDPSATLTEVRGRLAVLRHGLERDQAELVRADAQIESLSRREAVLAGEVSRGRRELEEAVKSGNELARRVEETGTRLAECEQAVEEADEACRAAEVQWHAWVARAEVLEAGIEDSRSRSGAEALSDLDGVVGLLCEVVEVEPGWERAFEAAIPEALAVVVVEDDTVARAALARLLRGATPGAVLPAVRAGSAREQEERPLSALGPVPGSGMAPRWQLLRPHVWSDRPDVERLLDVVLDGVLAVDGGWEDALEVHLAASGRPVVTREGGRFSRAGWRCLPGSGSPSRAAAEEATERAAAAARSHDLAVESLRAARDELVTARSAAQDAARAADRRDAERSALSLRLQRAEVEIPDVAAELAAARAQRDRLGLRIDHDRAALEELSESLPALEAESAATAERAAAAESARAHLDERAAATAALRTELEVRIARVEQRRQVLSDRLEEVRRRLQANRVDHDESSARRHLELAGTALSRLTTFVEARLEWLEARRLAADSEQRRRLEATSERTRWLESKREERVAAERRLAELRERAQRVEIEDAEIRLRQETALEAVRRELDCEPEVAIAAPAPQLPEGVAAAQRARDLERELRLMGPVNPLALEELGGLSERHELLESQLEDVRAARRELGKVIRAIDAEIVDVFAAAYADVADHFSDLFATLFPGGGGQLRLSDASNLLETGIEIEARPAGRNVRKLSLLSGGERSLVALAFLFAIFRSRPSPFYLMDEVEAALDDVNLHRFLDLVHEFRDEAQLIVVSHQKRTMEAADALLGVTMQPGGTSKVVSERVRRPEAQPA